MKLTKEMKQKIDSWFESKSEEEVKEILKGYGIEVPEKQSSKKDLSEIFFSLREQNLKL